ncbi:uncharacterized protein LOC118433025 [Folsomia candida]|uniref:uncharacterized protein LOC118433025 n=1 Tax=Folsomia candida TaxID=158441 RepID=UPI001605523F|nr:uncharacterized protein LOC118433025 [Folsomia candida]
MLSDTALLSKTYQWTGNDLIKEDLRIGSIGPCFDRCDPRNWQGDEKHSVEVTFYEYHDFKGLATNVNLSGGCVTLNKQRREYLSIRTHGQCVVLYALEECKDTRGHHVLQSEGKSKEYYVQKLLTGTTPYFPKSIRLCGNDQLEVRDDCHAGGFCLKLSCFSVLWGIILLIFVGIILISLSALGGVLIFKSFVNHVHQGNNTAMLDVVYKSNV